MIRRRGRERTNLESMQSTFHSLDLTEETKA
jgi:hypothetical protein